jgi:aldehyde:ferredoxin oxidoreductase
VLYGEEVTREQIADQGWQILQEEWAFNEKAGWKPSDDVLSDCLINEGIGPDHSLKFDVSQDIVDQVKTRFKTRDELFSIKAAG